jgi:phosphinothricin acetyltransferase
MSIAVRPATADDAARVAAIYNQGIEERQATFETRPRGAAELAEQIGATRDLPFLVAELDGEVMGWARVFRYSPRDCYAGVGEASIYVDRAARGRGVGRRLIDALGAAAEREGYWKLIGLLFPENGASVALMRAAGFREVGTYRRHGRLEGRWRDVVVLERLLDGA